MAGMLMRWRGCAEKGRTNTPSAPAQCAGRTSWPLWASWTPSSYLSWPSCWATDRMDLCPRSCWETKVEMHRCQIHSGVSVLFKENHYVKSQSSFTHHPEGRKPDCNSLGEKKNISAKDANRVNGVWNSLLFSLYPSFSLHYLELLLNKSLP